MLDEADWEQLQPYLADMTGHVKAFRERTGATIDEAHKQGYERPALARYYALTGFFETNADALWHHRLSLYGPPCEACGKLLRTSRARFCAACGHRVATPD